MPSCDWRDEAIINHSAPHNTSELERLCKLVIKHKSAILNLKDELEAAIETISELQVAGATDKKLTGKVAALKEAFKAEKLKAKRLW